MLDVYREVLTKIIPSFYFCYSALCDDGDDTHAYYPAVCTAVARLLEEVNCNQHFRDAVSESQSPKRQTQFCYCQNI